MVDWWRGSLEVGGVELVEVLSKAPPEGMTQQQELTWARRRLKLSTHRPPLLFKAGSPLICYFNGTFWILTAACFQTCGRQPVGCLVQLLEAGLR